MIGIFKFVVLGVSLYIMMICIDGIFEMIKEFFRRK